MEIKPLKQQIHEYVLEVLVHLNGNRTKTATALKISVKSVRNYIAKLKDLGYVVPDPAGGFSAFNKKMMAKRKRKL